MSRRTLAAAVCIGLAILFSASGPRAQEAWERIALLGLDTQALAVDTNDNYLYAGTNLGVWRSADWGETWEQSLDSPALAHTVVTDLISAGSADGTLFAVTEDGFVFRCTNARIPIASGGFTFQQIKGQSQEKSKGTSLAVDPRYDGSSTYDTLFLGTLGEAVFSTSNAANTDPTTVTWAQDSSTPIDLVYDLAAGISGTDFVLFVGGTGNIDGPLFRRSSGGSYSNISVGLGYGGATEVVTCLLPLPATPTNTLWAGTLTHGLYKTTNATGSGGFTEACDGACGGTVCETRPRVNALARSLTATPLFIEGRDDGPRLSADDAATCTDLPFRGSIQAVAFQRNYNGTNKCYLFYGTPSGLYRRVLGTCTTATTKRGPEIVDGYSVALAGEGDGKFMGSLSGGLFKSVELGIHPGNMVRYNNFPNKKTPQVVAVCLPKDYNEAYALSGSGCGTHDEMMVFVAANFPDAPGDNGVYKSKDWGNSWEKMTSAGWPTGPVWMYDLAISPTFDITANEITLFAATSRGLYRWDGDTVGWVQVWSTSAVYAVGLAPTFDFGTSTEAVFISWDDGGYNRVQKSNTAGDTWTNTLLSSYITNPGRVTGFAFPRNYVYASSDVFVSATSSPSIPTGVTGGIYQYHWTGTIWRWYQKTPTIPGATSAWDIAAEPDFQNSATSPLPQDLYVATDGGLLKSMDAATSWSVFDSRPAFSVTYRKTDFTGNTSMVGLQGRTGVTPNDYGGAIQDDESLPFMDFWGYHFLPDDVWASVAHERDTDILFSTSPSMGVFVSEDKGLSFRPWNEGIPDDGPCVIRTALGINMLADRRGTNYDVVWAGTDGDGIKGRYIYYDTSTIPPHVDLETANGIDASGWLHNTWSAGGAVTGRWERIEVSPNTACSYPVWATSPALGMASLQGDLAECSYAEWKPQNSGLASLVAKGVRQGYQSLASGTPLNGESVPYHQWNYYQVQVPVGTQDLRVQMDDLDDGGALDPDLYLRHGSPPGLSAGQYDYRPYINGDETVCVRPTASLFSQGFTTIMSEAFTSGIPGTWTVVDGGSGGGAAATWVAGNNTTPCTISPDLPSPFAAPWIIVDSNCAGNGVAQDEQLITPTLNLSGYSAVFLTFTNQFYRYPYPPEEVADVDVSIDGGANWTNVLRMTGADDPSPLGVNTKNLDLTPYAAGKSSVKIRFHYTGAWDYWWAVDNVEVTGLPTGWYVKHDGSLTPPAGTWSTANPCGQTVGAPLSAPFLMVDNSCTPAGTSFDELVYAPAVDCSSYSKVTLSYDLQFNWVDSSTRFYIYVSTDSGYSWTPVKSYTTADFGPATDAVNISSTAAGKSNVRVRFYYTDTGATGGGWVALDNVRIDGEGPKPGIWYIGVYGYAGTNSPYNLLATRNVGCTATPPGFGGDGGKREERSEAGCEEGFHQPEAPSTSTSWGTISGSGVYKGSGSASAIETVTWVLRNGTTSPLTNTLANTVVQLSDLTVIAGCDGDVYYSPAPDEGATTWVNATANLASPGSNDFRDLLVSSNGDVLIAANGTGTGTAAGGVWLSGDKGAHWMRLSNGFDGDSQELTDLMADAGVPPSYYSSTGATGEYTRTITANAYPTVTAVSPSSGPSSGGTAVTITGTGFLGTCPTGNAADCPLPNDKPAVLFGEVEVTPSAWTATSITCTTPPGSAGAAKVTVRNPDTRRSSTGPTYTYSCAVPSPVGTLTASDLTPYDFLGVTVAWTAPANWGDGAAIGRSYIFHRDGYATNTYTTATVSKTESLTPRVTPHSYFVRQNNGCGQSVDTASASAGDDAEAGAYTNSTRDMKWHAGGKTQLDWGNMTGETSYTVYRGGGSSVADLATVGGASVCAAYSGVTANTGAVLSSTPASGQFYWYLVTASAGTAEGTLGTGSGGNARKVASTGACGTP